MSNEMSDAITVESRKPVRFERYCIRCGKKTRGRLRNNSITAEPVDSVLGIFSFILTRSIWVPFCYRCKWNAFAPDKKCIYHLIAAFSLMGCFMFCFLKEYFVLGLISLLFAIVELIVAIWKNRGHERDAIPVKVHRKNNKIQYVFTSGHYYEKVNLDLLEKEAENDL